jgi:hypothetical protein
VYICVAGGQVVLLDLVRDQYIAVLPPHRLARWVRGWPAPAGPGPLPAAQDPVLSRLLASGMLAGGADAGKDAAPVSIRRAPAALVEPDFESRPRVTLTQLLRLVSAHVRARWQRTRWPMGRIVSAMAAARARPQTSAGNTGLASLRGDVAAFLHLRPLLYTVQDGCLLDCLTLLHYLAPRGIFPEWVFGVQADPFLAHCWLQQGDFVFNDHPDRVRPFTPILVV